MVIVSMIFKYVIMLFDTLMLLKYGQEQRRYTLKRITSLSCMNLKLSFKISNIETYLLVSTTLS